MKARGEKDRHKDPVVILMPGPGGQTVLSFWDRQGQVIGGDERTRTADPHVANVVLSQLSYIPTICLI